MKETLSQSLNQRLQQRLSPMQMRLVRMLEMSEPEIEEEVRRELDDNPALEAVERPAASDHDDQSYGESAEQMQLADYASEDDIPPYRLEARNRGLDYEYAEPVAVAAGESLMESLMSQLAQTDLDRRQLAIASYIVGNLDDNGYMTRTLPQIEDDLAIDAGIDVTMDELKEIFARIRSLDPAGVGAYDLRDCLSLQLRRLPDTPPVKIAREIVADYFDIFSLRHFDRLASALGVSRDELREADEVIRSLDPKPASLFGESDADERARHIIPDFYVDVDQDDRITVSMPNNIPELSIERSFDITADNSVREADMSRSRREALAFISRKRQEASDFIELLRMRRVTLMNVMEAIARIQREFFITEDEGRLRPMVLKDIAAITGQDISVISRATAGKYVATQAGVYPLKFFFNERVGDSDDVSSREIMAAIQRQIQNEDSRSPLSDDALTARLTAEGYDIARRTVAKYRERLGIPVARLRKKI